MNDLLKTINKNLDKVQANILIPHGRNFVRCIFIQFTANPLQIRNWISHFAQHPKFGVTAAHHQQAGKAGIITCFFLTAGGFQAMGFSKEELPKDPFFRRGMQDDFVCRDFNDPAVADWEDQAYQQETHAMILLADDHQFVIHTRSLEIEVALAGIGKVLFTEDGARLRRDHYDIEPFGYKEDISQPKLWTKNKRWVLKEDCKVVLDNQLGSYLVFRKLEQDLSGFEQKIQALSQSLGISKALAEAQVMGRHKDGTPLTLFEQAARKTKRDRQLVKQFDEGLLDYTDDDEGWKCPLHAHIRKVNPRNNRARLMGSYPFEVQDIVGKIIRRSMPYNQAERGVGLLFMCYQRSIEVQFRVIQKIWCNDNGGSNPVLKGVDPVVGNKWKNKALQQEWNQGWDQPGEARITFDFSEVVQFKGGALLYAPSIPFLAALGV